VRQPKKTKKKGGGKISTLCPAVKNHDLPLRVESQHEGVELFIIEAIGAADADHGLTAADDKRPLGCVVV